MKIHRAYWALGVVATAVASVALAATFNLFQPATGVLKGNASTYVTTAAVSADIRGLWTGTCDAATFLRGDGSCATPSGTGVSSVGLSMPSVFTVTGSPVTSSGTLTATFATGQTQNSVLATPNGSSGALSLRTLVGADVPAANLAASGNGGVTGTLPVANGGTGAVTLTGPLKGNGTSAFTTATASDILGLWSGGCSSSNFLRGDGQCVVATGTPGGSTTQVQYNNAGAFGGAASLTYDNATGLLTSTAATSLLTSSTAPIVSYYETDATTTNRAWRTSVGSEALSIDVCNDAFSSCTGAIVFDRTANVIDAITIPAGKTTFNQAWTEGTLTGLAISLESAAPTMQFYTTGGTANNRRWRLGNYDSGSLNSFGIELTDDGGSSNGLMLSGSASGGVVSSTSLFGTTVNVGATSATTTLNVGSSSTTVAVTATAMRLNSVSMSQTQHGVYDGTGSGCTLLTGSAGAGTCSRASAGNYTVSWTQTFSGGPSCSATNASGTSNIATRVANVTTTAVTIILTSAATAAAFDGGFSIICVR